MKNKYSFTILFTLALSTIISIFAFTGVDATVDRFVFTYSIGDKAEDFSLKNVDGKMVSLADFTDAKGFILIFTCNTCPYSVANEDRIIELDKKYKSKGWTATMKLLFSKVSSGDSFELMKTRAKEKGFTFPYLLDEGQTVYPKYGATRTPHVFVLEKENADLIVRYIGAIDDSSRDPKAVKTKYVENAVDALLEGKEVGLTSTKAIGCSIKK